MNIAIAKPDYGIVGGFEVVLGRIEDDLKSRGHQVDWLTVKVAALSRAPFGVDVPDEIWERCPEFFGYMALTAAFREIDASGHDVLISTQPPSFNIDHKRHLSLFYHHHRVFYDLSDVYVEAGFAERRVHEQTAAAVRRVDSEAMAKVTHYLAASDVVRGRLATFNDRTADVSLYHAGIGLPEDLIPESPSDRFERPLCVSRHEFPKRTELFVHAMKFHPRLTGDVVGTGGRLEWVRSVDAALSAPGLDLDAWTDQDLWLCQPGPLGPVECDGSNVRFLGHVPIAELADLYRSALCVVAPAYLEDYGLTAIEAMAFGKPVIVCRDGGGLTEFVEDGVTGFVVEPGGRAIAKAVGVLAADPALAREMGAEGRERSREFTWGHASEEFLAGLARVAG
jgi:glycosyltransferase involved in cell wall biosynthesis